MHTSTHTVTVKHTQLDHCNDLCCNDELALNIMRAKREKTSLISLTDLSLSITKFTFWTGFGSQNGSSVGTAERKRLELNKKPHKHFHVKSSFAKSLFLIETLKVITQPDCQKIRNKNFFEQDKWYSTLKRQTNEKLIDGAFYAQLQK